MYRWIQQNKLSILGMCVGAIGGFLYWKYVGCSTGTCPITSKPINSTLYGTLMGYLLFNIFQKEPSQQIKK
jgi:F0F1-type ATP synthase assembly protein I